MSCCFQVLQTSGLQHIDWHDRSFSRRTLLVQKVHHNGGIWLVYGWISNLILLSTINHSSGTLIQELCSALTRFFFSFWFTECSSHLLLYSACLKWLTWTRGRHNRFKVVIVSYVFTNLDDFYGTRNQRTYRVSTGRSLNIIILLSHEILLICTSLALCCDSIYPFQVLLVTIVFTLQVTSQNENPNDAWVQRKVLPLLTLQ